MGLPIVSIIIVNYNTWHFLKPSLESIREHFTQVAYEVIVVDNNSNDGSNKFITTHFRDVVLIENTYNAGFAKANNQAARVARGDYLFLLNADTLIMNGKISEALDFMKKNDVGVLGPQLVSEDGTLQFSYQNSNTLCTPLWNLLKGIGIGSGQRKNASHKDIQRVAFLTGCALLIDHNVVKQYGLFDERFFFTAEERDFCYRLYRLGIKIYYYPMWVIKHYGHSGDVISPFHIINWIKSTIKFEKKHGGLLLSLIATKLFILLLIRNIIILLFKYVASSDRKHYKNMLIYKDILLWQLKLKDEDEVYRMDT